MKFKNLNYLVFFIYFISSSSSYSIERPDIKNLIIHNEKQKIENVEFFNSKKEPRDEKSQSPFMPEKKDPIEITLKLDGKIFLGESNIEVEVGLVVDFVRRLFRCCSVSNESNIEEVGPVF